MKRFLGLAIFALALLFFTRQNYVVANCPTYYTSDWVACSQNGSNGSCACSGTSCWSYSSCSPGTTQAYTYCQCDTLAQAKDCSGCGGGGTPVCTGKCTIGSLGPAGTDMSGNWLDPFTYNGTPICDLQGNQGSCEDIHAGAPPYSCRRVSSDPTLTQYGNVCWGSCVWKPANTCYSACALPSGIPCGQPTCTDACGTQMSCGSPVECCTPTSSWSLWSDTGTCGQTVSCIQNEIRTCTASACGSCTKTDGTTVGNGGTETRSTKSCVTAPGPVTLTYPSNNATGVISPTNLQWSLSSWGCNPPAQNYKVSFGTSSTPPQIGTVTTTSYTAPSTYNVLYYWNIVADNGTYTSTSPTWSFRTAPRSWWQVSGGDVFGANIVSNIPATCTTNCYIDLRN